MTNVTDLPRRGPRAGRRIALLPIIAGLFLLWFLLRGGSNTFTDYLFFSEVGFTRVFRGIVGTQFLLVLGFGLVFFALLWGNLVLTERLAPGFRPLGPGDEIVARYRDTVGDNAGRLRLVVAILFSLIAGASASGEWQHWLLFRHAQSFGVKDPLKGWLFGRDVGFYVFRLPFLQFLVGWLFTAVLITAVLSAVAHYLNGGIRLAPAALDRVTPQVRAHLSVLFAALALVKAFGYLVQRWSILYSGKGIVQGATYTDLKARLPAINLLLFASLVAAALFFVNIRRRGWTYPAVAVSLWLVLSVVVGGIIPAAVQSLSVNPQENSKERPYIKRNIVATRAALGLTNVSISQYQYNDNLTSDDLAANQDTVRNIRLWDPNFTNDTFESLQSQKSYYQFNDVDADRYDIDGQKTQVMASARELNSAGLPEGGRSWVNRHLQYTHGYGAVVAPANAATSEGNPVFTLKDVPPVGEPKITQPRVYFGENLSSYAVVNTKQPELDAPGAASHYEGGGGVALSSFARKLAFAIRFGEKNLLISGQITPKSRAIYYRDITQRVKKVAPFLRYDSDPYPVILDGKIIWILDAYTTSSHYPYAQTADTSRVPNNSGLVSNFNYVRNSVKVTVDAFTGKMTFYRFDTKDPVALAYSKIFPKLFTDASQMPDALRAHLRYPEDLFRIQTSMFGRYHLTKPDDWFSASDAWNVAPDPGTGDLGASPTNTSVPTPGVTRQAVVRMEPYYVLTRLPTDQSAEFQILQPFVPRSSNDSRKNLTAFMVAKSDPDSYGKLEAYVMPADQNVAGPVVIASEMQSDPAVAQAETFLGQSGSRIKRGNIVMLPLGTSIIAVRPMYVQAEGDTAFPQLRKVIVWHAGDVAIGDTLQDALTQLFGSAPPTQEEGAGNSQGGGQTQQPSQTVADLLAKAQAAFDAADKSLREGDLAGYQQHVSEARDDLNKAQQQQSADQAASSSKSTSA
ncbi:MAG TPA: UPF0182 family protein [Acidimicrobiales bacterium]|nr:UPF0182 family protein [Acidimicrobiales bacterium]